MTIVGSGDAFVVSSAGGGSGWLLIFSRLFLSVRLAAVRKCFLMAVRECPLVSRWWAKLQRRVLKSLSLFCFLNLRKFPTISPLKQLVG